MSAKVLIADDAAFMRMMIKDILTTAGYTVCGEAGDGAEALQKYKELKPDLVTMDIVMPDMTGLETVKEIVKFDAEARILMCTALGQHALINDALEAGAKDYIVKPFDSKRVLDAVEQILTEY